MKLGLADSNSRFLAGGGEMGALIREKDWSSTSVGDPENWPQSLRTTLSILLNSKFPMFLWWGSELTCFYNDAYRPSLGKDGKHPSILGMPAKEAWTEIWDIIKPLIDRVLAGGEATWSENQLVPIFRNGHIEDVYWTFSYSPVQSETGNIEGVLVVCNETTNQIGTLKKLEDSEQQFRNLIKESPISTSLFKGPEFIVEVANEEALHLWGKDKSIIGKKIIEAIPELEGQPYMKILEDVYNTGETYYGNENLAYLKIDGELKPIYVNFIYKALQDSEAKTWGTLCMGYDVTEQIESRKKVKDSEERSRLAVDSAMLGTFDIDVLTDEAVCSKRFCEIFGFDHTDIGHNELIKAIHPDDLHIRDEANKQAIATGNLNYEVRILWPDKSIHWINARGKYFYDEKKEPIRILGTVMDITLQKNLVANLQITESKFRNTVKQAPVGITILQGPQFIVEMANDAYLKVVDRKEAEFVGKPLFDSLPEVEETVHPLLDNVLSTGIPFHGIEYPIPVNRYGKQELSYFDFLYYPLKEDDGKISGIIVTVTDVSASVKAKHAVLESEKQFRNLVMQSPIPMAIFRGKDYIIEMANKVMFEKIWVKREADIVGRKALDVFPELKDQKYPELLHEVFTTGKSFSENESLAYIKHDDGLKEFYLDYEYAPLFGTDNKVSGIIITVNNVTERVEGRKKAEYAEERLRLAIEAADMGTFDWNLQTQQFFSSNRLKEIFGFGSKENITHQNLIDRFYPEDRHIREKSVEESFASGRLEYEIRIIWRDKSIHWIRVHGKILHDLNGAMQRMYGTVIDVTEQRTILENIKENEARFRLLADSMPQHIWTGDAHGNLNYFNQSVFDYSGLTPEQIKKDGWIQIVHPDEREENIRQWVKSVTTGEDFIFEHRFRRHDGEYRWQLSRAIPQKDADGNIQMWVGTSTNIQEQKTFANHLEEEVQKRTNELEIKNKELEKMNAELESFAYVSSHDLQEPLRKIQTFATLILDKERENLSDSGKDYFRRMQLAAKRMQLLIDDLLAYSRTSTVAGTFANTDLNEIIKEVKNELKETLEQKKATIETDSLCAVNIIPFQFRQLMLNLIGNSLKFSKPGIAPHIKVSGKMIKGDQTEISSLSPQKMYCHISVSDNGIGFDPKYATRIFEVFQRLHGRDQYEGTGIGLAIVKKIVENHNAVIIATGEPDKGAKFDIYFPV
jgi:PAS domain S-box-containing protein